MKKKIAGKLSTLAVALLMAAAMMATSPLRAQMAATDASAGSQATSPAQVVNQLLGMVEGDIVPLAEAMPADKYNFVPTTGNYAGVRSFAAQLQHVIHANYGMFGAAASMKPTMPGADQLKTKEQIVQALKASFVFAHQAAGTLNQENALETVKPVDGVSTRAGIMLFCIIHMNNHYGQLVEYLRMNGIVPPASR